MSGTATARLIYELNERESSSNFWSLRIDPRTGKPQGSPQRVTNWTDSASFDLSATADGRAVAFVRGHSIASVYVADIQGDGPRIRSTRKLTLTDYDNEAEGWTPDGKAIIFRSFRNGRRRQYKQALGSDTEEPLFAQPIDMDIDSARVSPDGTWLLYLVGNSVA